ncbi:thiamine diphosphokinase [Wenxinia saemankumensis]|uniref:Thiamine diphosphokinase n=1 Tax=Wenxinia saemankumensis TaxID=1447782 RepID=A0A1M6CH27_9RHOB|nr:thiamine diphosphokinase [Wenxinia saemankumensis]SHI60223.1 thiamine pyrophosphokinase [Wenxinia saemankumensis]
MAGDAPVVTTAGGLTLLGGGPVSPADLTEALALAPVLAAADGGADAALAAGLRPAAVIGDMDSLSAAARAAFTDVLHEVSEQETTDFDKALRGVGARFVIGLGFLGGRLDHALAALSVLAAHPGRRCLLASPDSVVFLCPPRVALDLAPGTTVSLWPIAPCRCESTGLRWPTAGLDLDATGRIGTSNAVEAGPVTLAPSAPALLAILPRPALVLAVRALEAAPVWGGS